MRNGISIWMQSQKVIKCPQYKCVLSKLTSIFTRAYGPSTCHSIGSNTYLMFIGLRFWFRMLPNNVSQQSNFAQNCQNTHIQSFYILKRCTMCTSTVHMLNISYASSKLFLILTVFIWRNAYTFKRKTRLWDQWVLYEIHSIHQWHAQANMWKYWFR